METSLLATCPFEQHMQIRDVQRCNLLIHVIVSVDAEHDIRIWSRHLYGFTFPFYSVFECGDSVVSPTYSCTTSQSPLHYNAG